MSLPFSFSSLIFYSSKKFIDHDILSLILNLLMYFLLIKKPQYGFNFY